MAIAWTRLKRFVFSLFVPTGAFPTRLPRDTLHNINTAA